MKLASVVLFCCVFLKTRASCTGNQEVVCETFSDLEGQGNDVWETLTVGDSSRSVPNESIEFSGVLSDFPNLQYLTIVSKLNKIDSGFSGLSNLLVLTLYNNSVKELSMGEFLYTSELVKADLRYNGIEVITGPMSANNLEIVNLSHNKIRKLGWITFDTSSLKRLILSHNKISVFESNRIFSENLVHLNLDNNEVYYVNERVFDLPNLKELILSNNKFRIFTANYTLPSLEMLDLSHNGIGVLGRTVFDKMPLLTYIYLNDNQLKKLPVTVFQFHSQIKANITELYLHNNKLEDLQFLWENERPTFREISVGKNPWPCKCLDEVFRLLGDRGIKHSSCDEEYFFKDGDKTPVCIAINSDWEKGNCRVLDYPGEAKDDFLESTKNYRCTR